MIQVMICMVSLVLVIFLDVQFWLHWIWDWLEIVITSLCSCMSCERWHGYYFISFLYWLWRTWKSIGDLYMLMRIIIPHSWSTQKFSYLRGIAHYFSQVNDVYACLSWIWILSYGTSVSSSHTIDSLALVISMCICCYAGWVWEMVLYWAYFLD